MSATRAESRGAGAAEGAEAGDAGAARHRIAARPHSRQPTRRAPRSWRTRRREPAAVCAARESWRGRIFEPLRRRFGAARTGCERASAEAVLRSIFWKVKEKQRGELR